MTRSPQHQGRSRAERSGSPQVVALPGPLGLTFQSLSVKFVVGAVTALLFALSSAAPASSASTSAPVKTAVERIPTMQPAKSKVYVRVDYVGGFVPKEYNYTQTPSTLLVDGKLYRPGAMVMIFPGPALRPIEERTVSVDAAATKARAVFAAAVVPKGGWGVPPVADAPTAIVTVTVDGKSRTVSVASFGFTHSGPGLNERQAAARLRLQAAIDGVDQLAGTPRLYRSTQLEAWVFDGGSWQDPQAEPVTPIRWPASQAPKAGCNIFPAKLLPKEANDQSTFVSADKVFRAVFRPVLPGEQPCKRPR